MSNASTPAAEPCDTPTFAALRARFDWRSIRGCPGRYLLAGGPTPATPAALFGVCDCRVFSSPGARDPVHVAPLVDGGIISYAHADGRFIHTLCDATGFARKLAALGLAV